MFQRAHIPVALLARFVHRLLVILICWSLLLPNVSAQSFETLIMPGKVIEGHAKYEEQCKSCHVRFDRSGQSALCKDCHREVAKDVIGKTGYHGLSPSAVGKVCSSCHTDHKGREAKIAAFDTKQFNHAHTDFPLRDAHAKSTIECRACHTAGKQYREAITTCAGCHKKDDVHKGGLGEKCAECHSEKTWKDAKFDHEKTRFSLLGKHISTACKDCHINGKYKDIPRDCNGCHKKDDTHKGKFGPKCESCHNAQRWASTFNHDRDTHYILNGKHRAAKCESCHKGTLYVEKLSARCISCHKSDDVHKGSQGEKCEACHNEKSWKTANFDHDKTQFSLRDKHRDAKCESCHKTGYKDKLSIQCVSCHRSEDAHKGRYGEKCEACHNAKDWKRSTFDHTKATRYALEGKHASAKCDACHTGKIYEQKLPTTCNECHAKEDTHKGKFGPKCETCHVASDWKKIGFDHSRDTKYPLLGKHQPLKCEACHKGTLYVEKLPSTCEACHRGDDPHKARYGAKCETCHAEQDWKRISFDHSRDTKYSLRGKHESTKCDACHTGDLYKLKLETTCISCHKKDDKHENQLGSKCETCHNEKSWIDGVNFDHNKSRFPLLGLHQKATCASCHKTPRYRDAPRECVKCHEKEDVHKQSMGAKCENCHNARSWKIWDFNHDKQTKFVLDGGHKGIKCEACHTKSAPDLSVVPLSTSCGACHSGDDVHRGGFGAGCDRCHVTENWKRLKSGVGGRRQNAT
jgi:hypothetical protein